MQKYYRQSTHFNPPFLCMSNSSVTKEYKLWWKGNHFDDINSLGKEGKHQTIALKSIKMSTAGVFSDFQQFLDADHELKEVRICKTFFPNAKPPEITLAFFETAFGIAASTQKWRKNTLVSVIFASM